MINIITQLSVFSQWNATVKDDEPFCRHMYYEVDMKTVKYRIKVTFHFEHVPTRNVIQSDTVRYVIALNRK